MSGRTAADKAMLNLFQPVRWRMRADAGKFLREGAGPAERAPSGPVVLSRALCRYRHFRAPPGLSKRQTASAARTYAQAHAPFDNAGSMLLRTPLGVGIWYWDQNRVAAAYAPAPPRTLVPESLLRGRGEGWRILTCDEGVEAQYWEEGALLASSWRRTSFTREQWAAFALGVEAPAIRPPNEPPPAVDEPLHDGGQWRRDLIGEPLSWRHGEVAFGTVALCALALAAFFTGQALRYGGAARADTVAVAALEADMSADQAQQRVRERLALLGAYDSVHAGADVLSASAEAMAAFAQFGLEPQGWSVSGEGFSATLAGGVAEVPVREIVAALDAAPSLCAAAPEFREGAVEFRARVTSPDAPCGADT